MALNLGLCFHRTFPAPFVGEVAEALEGSGVEQLWVIEDCFYTAGISLAATALARTERLVVGLGILPAVARNPAITAMEIATLANLAPGRVLAGVGHGVQSWMEQMGARTPSPLTTLEEVLTVVGRLLAGETVTFEGREVTMRDVALDQPPSVVPPVLAGVRRPRSLALAGRVCDGVVLAEPAGPTYVRAALDAAGRPDGFRVSAFGSLCLVDDRRTAYRIMAPFVASLVAEGNPGLEAHPHIDELRDRIDRDGPDGLVDMAPDRWLEIGPIGTMDDGVEFVGALADAGATDLALFPAPEVPLAREDLTTLATLHTATR